MKMTMTINESMFHREFRLHGCSDTFSSNGLTALYNHLEEVFCEDTEYEYNLDVVSLCCEYTEYASALDAVYGSTDFECEDSLDEDFKESEALKYLQKKTQFIIFIGGIIIQNF